MYHLKLTILKNRLFGECDMTYTFYYRNYLKNCNYKCEYCPFHKYTASEKMIERDKKYLYKFIKFIKSLNKKVKIFFAPKGEALIYDYYKEALVYLSYLENVDEMVIQTNLSGTLEWIDKLNSNKLILWASYHPDQVDAEKFFTQVKKLINYNIKFTVGTVGIKNNFTKIKEMKDLLSRLDKYKPYMWINSFKDEKNYYNSEEIKFLQEIDPLFEINLKDYESKGLECKAGESIFFLDWNGNVHRCWQYKVKIGNIYSDNLTSIKVLDKCEKNICGCYIGYSHIKNLKLEKVYRKSLLGRIP